MKKQLLLVLLALMPMIASAEEVEIDGLWYNLDNSANTAEVIQYKNNLKYSGDIEIPDVVIYDDVEYSVISIGDYAFSYCSGLTSITIPNSVTSIGRYAFDSCTSLTSITIPNSVTSISRNAFHNCTSLTSATIGNSVTSIWNETFAGCYRLTSITIPNSVTTIGEYAFAGCSGLTSITIPNSVTSIEQSAFNGCSGLTSVTIGNSVTSIGSRAFQDCSSLTSVHINDIAAWCNISFSLNYSNPLFYAHHLFLNGEEVKDLVIPNSVTSIGNTAFEYCSGLTSITIPNSVTTIGGLAFSNCTSLTSATIGNSVTRIGSYVFSNCYSLTSVTIPNSVTSIGNYAFQGCSGLTSITIPNSVTYISNNAFWYCSNLTSVNIGTSVESIDSYAFAYCQKLTDVYCYAEKVPSTNTNAFESTPIGAATLYVPASAYEAYRTTQPWSGFGTIESIKQCATPTITYSNGKVRFACETEGVEYVPTITVTPNQQLKNDELEIGGTFTVSVYAVKDGFDDSDTATMTINMSQMGDVNADGELNAADITAVVNAILGK